MRATTVTTKNGKIAGISISLNELFQPAKGFSEKIKFQAMRKSLPHCCVYLAYCKNNLVYIGMTGIEITTRMQRHRGGKSLLWLAIEETENTDTWELILLPAHTRKEAYQLESEMIMELKPKLNTKWQR